MELNYYGLLHELEGYRIKVSDYKDVTKNFPRIKFIRHHRNKKCRGYWRKLYKSLMPLYTIYSDGIDAFNDYMSELNDKSEKDRFYKEYIESFESQAVTEVLRLAKDVINGHVDISTKILNPKMTVHSNHREIYYRYRVNKKYVRYSYDLENMKIVMEPSDTKWNVSYVLLSH